MAKYKMWSQANGTMTEHDTLTEARKYAISKIRLNRMGKYKFKDIDYRLKGEMIQARNDGRDNFIVIVRGPGGNKSYCQIIDSKGKIVSPKLSVYALEYGWKNGLSRLYKY